MSMSAQVRHPTVLPWLLEVTYKLLHHSTLQANQPTNVNHCDLFTSQGFFPFLSVLLFLLNQPSLQFPFHCTLPFSVMEGHCIALTGDLPQVVLRLSASFIVFHFKPFGKNQRLRICLKTPKYSHNLAFRSVSLFVGAVTRPQQTVKHNLEHTTRMLQFVIFQNWKSCLLGSFCLQIGQLHKCLV